MEKSRGVWAEIDLKAIAHNVRELRRITSPQAGLMAVVKANGYGHGAAQVARAALENGASRLAVATLGEAIRLRREGIGVPIMIFGYTPEYLLDQVLEYDIIQTVFSEAGAAALSEAAVKAGKRTKVHLKIDTGMGRIGFRAVEDPLKDILSLAKLPGLEIEGIFSHFAVADCRDKAYTEAQFELFMKITQSLAAAGLEIPLRHICNSAGIIELPEAHLDLVRPGISIYGYYPSNEVDRSKLSLKPAMTLKCEVALLKEVGPGSSISYGCTYQTKAGEIVATLPIGYADGYTRLFSSKAEVLIKGTKAPIIGRVCMDQCMARVSHIEGIKAGDEVILMGSQSEQHITADDLAELIGTISYEILCMISERVPRVYIS